MVNEVSSRVATRYTEWLGTVAADNRLPGSELLGIDTDRWMVVLMTIAFGGGGQCIRAWGIEHGSWALYQSMAASGRIEVTRLVDRREHPSCQFGFKPTPAPTMPITLATDLLTYGFKQLEIRLEWTCHGTRPGDEYEFVEVGSVVA